MAKNTQTKTGAKTLARSRRKSRKRAKVRASPLLSGHAKKTTLARRVSKKSRPADRRTPAKRLLETIEEVRARTAVQPHEKPIASGTSPALAEAQPPKRGSAQAERSEPHRSTSPRTGILVDALPRAATMTIVSLSMMVSQQARAFGLMLDLLQRQRQFFDMWRPRHR